MPVSIITLGSRALVIKVLINRVVTEKLFSVLSVRLIIVNSELNFWKAI